MVMVMEMVVDRATVVEQTRDATVVTGTCSSDMAPVVRARQTLSIAINVNSISEHHQHRHATTVHTTSTTAHAVSFAQTLGKLLDQYSYRCVTVLLSLSLSLSLSFSLSLIVFA